MVSSLMIVAIYRFAVSHSGIGEKENGSTTITFYKQYDGFNC